jgi:hypothetical protein
MFKRKGIPGNNVYIYGPPADYSYFKPVPSIPEMPEMFPPNKNISLAQYQFKDKDVEVVLLISAGLPEEFVGGKFVSMDAVAVYLEGAIIPIARVKFIRLAE